jgi:hypothetical protein
MDEMMMVVCKRNHRSIKENQQLLVKDIYDSKKFKTNNIVFYGIRGLYNIEDFVMLDGRTIKEEFFFHHFDLEHTTDIKFVTCRATTYKYLETGQVYKVSQIRKTYKAVKVKLEGIKGWYQLGDNITPPTHSELTIFKIEQYKRMTALHNIYSNEEHRPTENSTITHDQCQDSHRP